jgi:hypothetical protein
LSGTRFSGVHYVNMDVPKAPLCAHSYSTRRVAYNPRLQLLAPPDLELREQVLPLPLGAERPVEAQVGEDGAKHRGQDPYL